MVADGIMHVSVSSTPVRHGPASAPLRIYLTGPMVPRCRALSGRPPQLVASIFFCVLLFFLR